MLKNCFNKAIFSDICPVQVWHTMQDMEKVTPFSSPTVTTITIIQLKCLIIQGFWSEIIFIAHGAGIKL